MTVSTVSTKRATGDLEKVTAGMDEIPPALSRSSGEVWCSQSQRYAAVSVIRRQAATGMIRYVQWCSLRGAEPCSEECIRQPPSAPDSAAGRRLVR
jgi:hypothetical protein